jgi:N-acyl homoserine lactone hydrolase
MVAPSITVTPVHVADLVAAGQVMPGYAHVIDHPEERVLVHTGLTVSHPLVADMDPRIDPRGMLEIDPAPIGVMVNTHLHYDHCGGNHLFAGNRSTSSAKGSGLHPVVVGDLAVSSRDLDVPQTPGQFRVRDVDPALVWLSHQHEPWRPSRAWRSEEVREHDAD